MSPWIQHVKNFAKAKGYKKWTADTRQKQIAGFTTSLRARTGDDSFDQE